MIEKSLIYQIDIKQITCTFDSIANAESTPCQWCARYDRDFTYIIEYPEAYTYQREQDWVVIVYAKDFDDEPISIEDILKFSRKNEYGGKVFHTIPPRNDYQFPLLPRYPWI